MFTVGQFYLAAFGVAALTLAAPRRAAANEAPAVSTAASITMSFAADPFEKPQSALAQGNWKQARRDLKPLKSNYSKTGTYWLIVGRTDLGTGKLSTALKHFEKALKYEPQLPEAFYWRGRIFERQGKLDEAANEYQAAIHARAGYTEAETAWKKLSDSLNLAGSNSN